MASWLHWVWGPAVAERIFEGLTSRHTNEVTGCISHTWPRFVLCRIIPRARSMSMSTSYLPLILLLLS